MEANKVFGQGAKGQGTDKLNIDSIIARLLEGEMSHEHHSLDETQPFRPRSRSLLKLGVENF